jgi:hypothetical protein
VTAALIENANNRTAKDARECRLVELRCQSLSYILYKTAYITLFAGRAGMFCGEILGYEYASVRF